MEQLGFNNPKGSIMDSIIEIINTKDTEPGYLLSETSVGLVVYPRVHMLTFDLSLISGILKHGSFGYSLKNMPIKIIVKKTNRSKKDEVFSNKGKLLVKNLDFEVNFNKLRKYIKSEDYYTVEIESGEFTREHTGLGISTQILGGIYLCCAKLSGVSLQISDLFILGIGHYSTLGLNLLFNPGMIFEMGVESADKNNGLIVNPKLSKKYEKPSNTLYKISNFPFYIVVAIPKTDKSISGEYEIDFWNNSLPDRNQDSYKIVYNVFENIIPSIIGRNFEVFAKYLNENIKLGSKPLEEKVQSARVKSVLNTMRNVFDFAAVSSLGPALYAFSKSDPTEIVKNININDYTYFVYGPDGNIKQKINSNESLIMASFACLGKTTFTDKNPDIALDIESIHYARNYNNKNPNDEIAKGDDNWRLNSEYPSNYIKKVVDSIGKYRVIFLTTAEDALNELDKINIKYTILYPGPKRKRQILIDAQKRGNDKAFVTLLDTLLSSSAHRKSFEKLEFEKFVTINDDSYIEQYISENYIL